MSADAPEDTVTARLIADQSKELGAFAVGMMIKAGKGIMDIEKVANEYGTHIAGLGRFVAVTNAFARMHKAMSTHQRDPSAENNQAVTEACEALAAEAALLAVRGDADWPYRPKEAGDAA